MKSKFKIGNLVRVIGLKENRNNIGLIVKQQSEQVRYIYVILLFGERFNSLGNPLLCLPEELELIS